jgi:site-specific DNA-methyltransferase (adenine-specific)
MPSDELIYQILEGDTRQRLKDLDDQSVHLVVTSPPYGKLKQYSHKENEIGYHQSLQDYHDSLIEVWRECLRVLKEGCRLVINVGDEFVRSNTEKPYHVVPHHAFLINNIMKSFDNVIFNGTIHWEKVTTSKTSGGGKIMGSVYNPRDGHFFINYEHIIVFKKLGKGPRVSMEQKEESKFTLEERREWFQDTWKIVPERQNDHIAMFPMELPERLIRMYSFTGETVLDPFVGSGTTLAAAAKLKRSGLGIELGFTDDDGWKNVIRDKLKSYISSDKIQFH